LILPISTKLTPKTDNFPLPKIDQLVEVTSYEPLSFMNAYSGYNQIKMYQPDEDKTAFTTDQGIFCYKVVSFRFKNTRATF